jgi:hypothetical protein
MKHRKMCSVCVSRERNFLYLFDYSVAFDVSSAKGECLLARILKQQSKRGGVYYEIAAENMRSARPLIRAFGFFVLYLLPREAYTGGTKAPKLQSSGARACKSRNTRDCRIFERLVAHASQSSCARLTRVLHAYEPVGGGGAGVQGDGSQQELNL